MRSFVQFERN